MGVASRRLRALTEKPIPADLTPPPPAPAPVPPPITFICTRHGEIAGHLVVASQITGMSGLWCTLCLVMLACVHNTPTVTQKQ